MVHRIAGLRDPHDRDQGLPGQAGRDRGEAEQAERVGKPRIEQAEPTEGGRGILIATGDLTISGSELWQGVVLVGGKLTSNGNNTVSGATISGLNVKLGMSVPMSDVGNGTKTFQYNSCHIASAMQAFGGSLHILENTWLDNWAAY